ncbi:hypothetical protein BGW38_002201 [Lunasporangiospora selenospora]|uniref:ATPase inhibitor, mitochondrial n=1 Tax=Lunasporangiospora selenospora TaxID=979761 RepID=A0A9P6FSQ4_9FUNG|nr:hypothetical protein BGW38_002201 [Lunasporangiospora selenospora]
MLRATTTTAVRAFKPVQVSAIARPYSTGKFNEKERAEEEIYFRKKEQEEIAKLREALAKAEKQIEDLKKN